MDLVPAPVLLFGLIVVTFAAFARHRGQRPRQLADVGGFMSSSYAADVPDGEEGGPAARHIWADTGTWPTEPIVVESPTVGAAAVVANAVVSAPGPAPEPFEYPEPTSLEQRGALVEIDDPTGSEAISEMTDDLTEPETAPETASESEAAPDPERPTLRAVSASSRSRDPLTGMLDPNAFEEVMAQEAAREQRYGHPATVVVFELDGLAKLVDRLGSEPGERIEVALADSMARLARRADHVARLDRGRYAVLLPETDEVAAINYVERIRRACELWLESGAMAMHLSIGWASTSGDAGLSGAMRVATDRLRQEQRRNTRGAGDTVPDLELIKGDGPTQAAAAL